MITINDYPYFQPQHENGDMPEGLFSFQAFRSEQEAIDWMDAHLDEQGNDDIEIREYCNDDIEDVTLIDYNGDIIPKIEDLSDEEIADMITDRILIDAGSIDNLHATRQSDETEDQFKDRVYGEALDLINDTIACIEEDNEYDFSSYGGNPDVEWFDEAREQALWTVMDWMLEDYPY
jgi:hypothetical protein